MDDKLLNRINDFLKDRVESDGGWAPATLDERDELYGIFNDIIEAKYESDLDGDLPIQVRVNNRVTYQKMTQFPLAYIDMSYSYGDVTTYLSLANANLRMAQNDVERGINHLSYLDAMNKTD